VEKKAWKSGSRGRKDDEKRGRKAGEVSRKAVGNPNGGEKARGGGGERNGTEDLCYELKRGKSEPETITCELVARRALSGPSGKQTK